MGSGALLMVIVAVPVGLSLVGRGVVVVGKAAWVTARKARASMTVVTLPMPGCPLADAVLGQAEQVLALGVKP
ncbi:hypothetical protein HD596_007835 [Nonomuraea jabiensis]|uniref:Uncharacterized protein n=1 Tax=Nonomuraea jabiensis TaxID=882448 RepID=A0A7W9LER3_9ACTN|nr:hypothetical protein [Nonomuraea jabiensis]